MKLNKKKQQALSICVLVFAALRLQNYFVPIEAVQCLSAILLIGIVLATIPSMNRGTQGVLIVLFLIGAGLLIASGSPLATWKNAVLSNGNLIALLILVPMISSPFYYEDYQSELANLARLKMHNVVSFLALVAISTHILSVVVSVGAILVVYNLMSPYATLYRAEKPFLTTVSRGYNSSGFWSPAWASVIVYSALPEVKWLKVIPVGIALSLLFLGLHLGSVYLETKRFPDRYPEIQAEEGTVLHKGKLYTMLALTAAMILTIVVLNGVTGWDLMITVSVASLIFPLGASIIQQKRSAYEQTMRVYFDAQLPKVHGQVALFMLSGFFGKALSVSGAAELLIKLLPDWLTAFPPLMIAALMLLLILPSLLGVHPAATGTAIATAIAPAAVGLTSYTFALTIIVGWLLTIMVAPYSATALLLSGLTGKNNYSVSVGINWAFTLICLAVFSLLISVIGPIMG